MRFGFFTLAMVPYRLALVPQLRAPWLRMLGALPYWDEGGGFESPEELVTALRDLQDALVRGGAARAAWGGLQDFVWQVETFGFHLASLEVRQHAAVHRAALSVLEEGGLPVYADIRSAIDSLDAFVSYRLAKKTGADSTAAKKA